VITHSNVFACSQGNWRNDALFAQRDVVQINGMADDLIPIMAANLHVRSFVDHYFSDGFIFQRLAAFLLRLTPELRYNHTQQPGKRFSF
jgi:hypothetical protein